MAITSSPLDKSGAEVQGRVLVMSGCREGTGEWKWMKEQGIVELRLQNDGS